MGRFAMKVGWALAALITACGAVPEDGQYAGALEGSDARAALVVEEGSILLFLCGGASTLASTRWLSGPLEDDRFAMKKKGVRVEGRFEEGRVLAELDDGSTFVLERMDETRTVGLFHTRVGACRTGVIAAGDWMQGVSCDAAGRLQQVSPDGPLDANGFMVQSGSRRLFVSPVHPR
jgi:hypothetical protein